MLFLNLGNIPRKRKKGGAKRGPRLKTTLALKSQRRLCFKSAETRIRLGIFKRERIEETILSPKNTRNIFLRRKIEKNLFFEKFVKFFFIF